MKTGDRIGEYRIVRPGIARGASSIVHEAVDRRGRRVALKILSLAEISPQRIDRFKNEYQILSSLSHPHVAKAIGFGVMEGKFYFATEFIEGVSLASYLWGKEPSVMLPLFLQTLSGLDAIHQRGLLHLDIKSENVLVQEIEGKPHVVIIDVGLTRTPKEYEGEFLGTLSYMAPEVILGKGVDARADLFSFGVLMYACLTWGELPFARTKSKNREALRRQIERQEVQALPSAHHPNRPGFVPHFLEVILLRLLKSNINERSYLNAQAVRNAIATQLPNAFVTGTSARTSYFHPGNNQLIGREREQQLLRDALKTLTKRGLPQACVLWGGSGIGKSHLLRWMKRHVEKRAEHFSLHEFSFPAEEGEMERWLDHFVEEVAQREKPRVVLIDNLHECADFEQLQHWMELQLQSKTPLLIVATSNDHLRGAWTSVPLVPWRREELASALTLMPAFKETALPNAWVDHLFTATNGTPGEVIELLHLLDRGGPLFTPDGRIAMHFPAEEEEVSLLHLPTSTQERFRQLYDEASVAEQQVIAAIALWDWRLSSRPLQEEELLQIVDCSSPLHVVRLLEERGIVREEKGGYRLIHHEAFAHIVLERCPARDIACLHDRIAHLLFHEPTLFRRFHLSLGSDAKQALAAIPKLARELLSREGNISTALFLLRRGLEHALQQPPLRQMPLRALLIEALGLAGCFQEAEEEYERSCAMLAPLQRGGKVWQLELAKKFAPLLLQQKKYAQLETLVDRSCELCKRGSIILPSLLVMLNVQARSYYEQGFEKSDEQMAFWQKARHLYEMTAELAHELPLANRDRVKNNDLGQVLLSLGFLPDAIFHLERELRESTTRIFHRIQTLYTLAQAYRLQQQFQKAHDAAENLLEIAKKTRQRRWMLYGHEVLASICHDQDRFQEGLRHAHAALAACATLESLEERRSLSLRLFVQMGHCHKELCEWTAAVNCFEAVTQGGGEGVSRAFAFEGLGEVAFLQGDYQEAQHHLRSARGLIQHMPPSAAIESCQKRIEELECELP